MDEHRIERGLRQGPPFRTRFVPRPLSLGGIRANAAVGGQGGQALPWVLIMVLILTLAIAGAAVIGSGIVKLPIVVEAPSAPPTPTAQPTPTQSVDGPWTTTGAMVQARTGGTATLLRDGRVLVAGGTFGDSLHVAELYEPVSRSWIVTGGMHARRDGHAATRLADGRVLVTGGSNTRTGQTTASAEVFDPIAGTWTVTGDMSEGRAGHTATLLPDGRVLVAGGGNLDSAEVYDPTRGTWTPTGNLHEARRAHTATLLRDGTVLAVGGLTQAASSDGVVTVESAEIYDPDSGSWTATGAMVEAINFLHTATTLADGRVLVVAGTFGNNDMYTPPSAQLYDPDSGSWIATGRPMEVGTGHEIGFGHTATLLPDGTVLVAGGKSSPGDPLVGAQIYDPASGSWSAATSMPEIAAYHVAVLLADGTVLLAGGNGDGAMGVALSQLYDPRGGP